MSSEPKPEDTKCIPLHGPHVRGPHGVVMLPQVTKQDMIDTLRVLEGLKRKLNALLNK